MSLVFTPCQNQHQADLQGFKFQKLKRFCNHLLHIWCQDAGSAAASATSYQQERKRDNANKVLYQHNKPQQKPPLVEYCQVHGLDSLLTSQMPRLMQVLILTANFCQFFGKSNSKFQPRGNIQVPGNKKKVLKKKNYVILVTREHNRQSIHTTYFQYLSANSFKVFH